MCDIVEDIAFSLSLLSALSSRSLHHPEGEGVYFMWAKMNAMLSCLFCVGFIFRNTSCLWYFNLYPTLSLLSLLNNIVLEVLHPWTNCWFCSYMFWWQLMDLQQKTFLSSMLSFGLSQANCFTSSTTHICGQIHPCIVRV